MPRHFTTLLAAAASLLGSSALAQDRWLAGFYPGWEYEFYPPERIDFSSLTHVVMFSVVPEHDGSLDTSFFVSPETGRRIALDLVMRAHAAGRKALLSVGGAGLADRMREAAGEPNRPRFVDNLANLVKEWNYDGLDIDWEPIEPGDLPDLRALAEALRTRMPDKVLAIDLGWKNANFPIAEQETQFLREIEPLFDHLNVMTYDMADTWAEWLSWHNSPLYGESKNTPASGESSVEAYIDAGIPPAKLGLGVAFYGQCWTAPVSAPGQVPGMAKVAAGDQDMSYRNIMTLYYNLGHAAYDATAEVPYLTFPEAAGAFGCTFVSYEDERSIAAKGAFAKRIGLGGAIIWSLGEGYLPDAPNPNSLLHAARKAFLD